MTLTDIGVEDVFNQLTYLYYGDELVMVLFKSDERAASLFIANFRMDFPDCDEKLFNFRSK